MSLRVERKLDIGLLTGYLDLDVRELMNPNTTFLFQSAREVLNENAINLLARQVGLLGSCTSIIARMIALTSLLRQRSYSILGMTALLPMLEKAITNLPWWRLTRRRKSWPCYHSYD